MHGNESVDVVIVGGGINGTAVARDCALRGLKVALFEKHDLGFGASGNNSGMIHGGPRYLTSEPLVTKEACTDSGYIQRMAPHLLFRIPFLVPLAADGLRSSLRLGAYDAFFAFYDSYQYLKRGRRHCVLTSEELSTAEPGLVGNFQGAVTFDEWGVDGNRLCALNAVDAAQHGGQIYTHHEVLNVLTKKEHGKESVYGVQVRDAIADRTFDVNADTVINATGAWCNDWLTQQKIQQATPLVRPGKGIHVLFDRRLSNYGVVTEAIDRRQIFIMPWYDISWIATTDDDVYGDLDDLHATYDEVAYLIEGVSRIFPAVKEARVIATTAAARPTLYEYGKYESDLSRDHRIIDHEAQHGIAGLYSMIGGKLASFRIFAESMSDMIVWRKKATTRCMTHALALPGGDAAVDGEALAAAYALHPYDAQSLIKRQGTTSWRILSEAPAAQRQIVCPCQSVTEAELRHVCRHEFARTLGDVSRRTRLGQGPCGGMWCAHRAAQCVAHELKCDAKAAFEMADQFLDERARNRSAGGHHVSLAQEQLLQSYRSFAGHADLGLQK